MGATPGRKQDIEELQSLMRTTTSLFYPGNSITKGLQDKLDDARRARDASNPQWQLLSVLAAKVTTVQKRHQVQTYASAKHRDAAAQYTVLAEEAEQRAESVRVEFEGLRAEICVQKKLDHP